MKRIFAAGLAALLAASALPVGAVNTTYKASEEYISSEYYKNLLEVRLTGNNLSDIVNVALTQVGYHEGSSEADRDGMNMDSSGNYTEYGFFSDCDGYAWCAMFVSWCARQAGVPESLVANSRVARAPYFEVPFFYKGEYVPKTGDIVFFAQKGEEWTHVGIVMLQMDDYVYTVEGNSGDMVRVKRYPLDDDFIKGYGVYIDKAANPGNLKRGNIYAVNYDLNGGEGQRRSQYITHSAPLKLYKNAPAYEGGDDEEVRAENSVDWTWKDGCDFLGWYVKRPDGEWLTAKNGWKSEDEIFENGYERMIYSDEATVIIDDSWGGRDFDEFTFYAAWADSETGESRDTAAYLTQRDSTGWGNPFYDLDENADYYSDVKEAVRKGLIQGKEPHRFAPGAAMTRRELVCLLYGIAGGDVNKKKLSAPPYSSLSEDDDCYEAVSWAYTYGILPNRTDLALDGGVSREEAVLYIYKTVKQNGSVLQPRDTDINSGMGRALITYSDISMLSPSCLEAVVWAQRYGFLFSGAGRRCLEPKAPVSRAAGCEMIVQLAQRLR